MSDGFQIEYLPVEALKPYGRNARTHSDEQIAQIAASIEEFGMAGAVVVRNGVLAKGHGTLGGICLLYGAGKPVYPAPGQYAEEELRPAPFPWGTVPVIDASGWSDEQFRAFAIADNKLGLLAGWDAELLRGEFVDLNELGFDLRLTGFEELEIADLLAGVGASDGDGEGGKKDNGLQLLIVSTDTDLIAEVKRRLQVPPETNRVSAHDVLRMFDGG